MRVDRRQLTIMFCDLVGSTALSSRLDPEDLLALVGRYRQGIATAVRPWGGFVAQFLGDGVLTYFGWPRAHEADAERAVRAALAVLDAVGRIASESAGLQVHIGIASGLVVVGAVPGPTGVPEVSAVGEAPNVAARMQQLAQPGTIVIDNATRERIGESFICRDLGEVAFPGLVEPAHAWRIVQERPIQSRQEVLRARQRTHFVDRIKEIGLLMREWERAKLGEGRVVHIVGEAGIGKSRLVGALEEKIGGEPHILLRYLCSLHQMDSELQPIISHIEHAARLHEAPSVREKISRLREMFAASVTAGANEQLGLAADPAEISVLADLLSIADPSLPVLQLSPQRRKERTFEALIRRVVRLAQSQPLLILLEDIQWCDPTTLELFDRSIKAFRRLPILLVVTSRPEVSPGWEGREGIKQIQLARLEPRFAEALVDGIASDTGLPSVLRNRIATQADGVPLFIEELTKAVLESRADRLPEGSVAEAFMVPDTLQSSLMARLDRLPEAKEVAQVGSVIGRTFSHAILAEVARLPDPILRERLDQLMKAQLVFAVETSPRTSYAFKHAMVGEVAYGSLLRNQRTELHARTYAALLQQHPELEEKQPASLGHHCAQAGLIEKAASYYRRAGERSAERAALAETRSQLERGLGLIQSLPAKAPQRKLEVELKLAFGRVLLSTQGSASEEAGRHFADAVAQCQSDGDVELTTRSMWGYWFNQAQRRELGIALTTAHSLLDLANKHRDDRARSVAHAMLGITQFWRGHFADGCRELQTALDLGDAASAPPFDLAIVSRHLADHARTQLAFMLVCVGKLTEAAKVHDAESAELSHLPTRAIVLAARCRYSFLLRDEFGLREAATALMKLSEEQSFPFYLTFARFYLGWLATNDGRIEQGMEILTEALSGLRSADTAIWQPHLKALVAEARLRAGQLDAAATLLDEAAQHAMETNAVWYDAEIDRMRGQVLRLRSGRGQDLAESVLRRAVETAKRQSGKLFELRAVVNLAELLADQGRRTEALDLLLGILPAFASEPHSTDIAEAKAMVALLG